MDTAVCGLQNMNFPSMLKQTKLNMPLDLSILFFLTEGIFDDEEKVRHIANMCVNLQGGKNNNMALDEYVELLNRDSN